MIYLVTLFLLVFPVAIAAVSPRNFVFFALFTGVIPFGIAEALPTPIGAVHVNAIKLFGVLIGCGVCCIRDLPEAFAAVGRYKLHLIFLCCCAISILWADDKAFALRMLAKLAGPFLFVVVTTFALKLERDLERSQKLVLWVALAALLFAALWEVFGFNSRGSLTLPNMSPGLFSAHLLPAFAICCAVFAYKKKPVYLLFATFLALGVLGGFTRITIAGMFASASVVFFLSKRGVLRIVLPIGIVVGFFALFFLVDEFRERMFLTSADRVSVSSALSDPLGTVDKIPGSGRFAAWDLVLERFFEPNPIVGAGLGATQQYFYQGSSLNLGVIHSEVVRLLAEVGVIGLFLFIAAAASYVFRLVRYFLRSRETEARIRNLAALGAFSTYLMFMLTDNAFDYVNSFAIYVFTLIGVAERSRVIRSHVARTRTPQPKAPSVDQRTART